MTGPRGGGVAVIQRFGGSINLHVHVHALVLDGVFARTTAGAFRFHAAPEPSAANLAEILAAIAPGVARLLRRHGVEADGATAANPFADASPLLAGWAAASVQGLAASGTSANRPRHLGQPHMSTSAREPRACHARWEGFNLHAGVRVPAGQRNRLERVCRYTLRAPLSDARLHRTSTGDVAVALRTPWANGTTHVALSPTAFLARLAVLVPRPRVNLVLYHGVLAPRASWRLEVVPHPPVAEAKASPDQAHSRESASEPSRGWRWADLMRRVFEIDVLACPGCGGACASSRCSRRRRPRGASCGISICRLKSHPPRLPARRQMRTTGQRELGTSTRAQPRCGGRVFGDAGGPVRLALRHRGPRPDRANVRRVPRGRTTRAGQHRIA